MGRELADLLPYLEKQEGITQRRAEIIALDQTHKAYNGFNRQRMIGAGVRSFQWLHSGGVLHPRELHLYQLNGQFSALTICP